MAHLRLGYFRLPSTEIGATLIFVPAYVKGTSALELALWAQKHGFGKMEYQPAKAVKDRSETGVHA